jgi:hypothetical protein
MDDVAEVVLIELLGAVPLILVVGAVPLSCPTWVEKVKLVEVLLPGVAVKVSLKLDSGEVTLDDGAELLIGVGGDCPGPPWVGNGGPAVMVLLTAAGAAMDVLLIVGDDELSV